MNRTRKINRKKSANAKAKADKKVKVHPAAINLLTDATWEFAYKQLWNNIPFSDLEKEISKIFIREFYEAIPAEKFSSAAATYFSGYCERILLAKKYVSRYPHRYIPHPCIWLDKRNPKGFAGTKTWYEENLKRAGKEQAYLVIPITKILPTLHFTA